MCQVAGGLVEDDVVSGRLAAAEVGFNTYILLHQVYHVMLMLHQLQLLTPIDGADLARRHL